MTRRKRAWTDTLRRILDTVPSDNDWSQACLARCCGALRSMYILYRQLCDTQSPCIRNSRSHRSCRPALLSTPNDLRQDGQVRPRNAINSLVAAALARFAPIVDWQTGRSRPDVSWDPLPPV